MQSVRNDQPNYKIDPNIHSFWSTKSEGRKIIMETITLYQIVERPPFTGYSSDDKYDGNLVENIREGEGTMRYSNGDIYSGKIHLF